MLSSVAISKRLFLLCCGLSLAGCVSSMGFVPGVTQGHGLRLTQSITVSAGEHRQQFIGVLELQASRTALAVVAPTGMFLFSIAQTPDATVVEKQADVPDMVDPRRILQDVELVNWPQQALTSRWGRAVKVDSATGDRSLWRWGRRIKQVRFEPGSGIDGESWQKAVLEDERFRYTIEVHRIAEERI